MFAHTDTDLYRIPDNGSSLCRPIHKDTTSLPFFGFDQDSQTFFIVTRTGADVILIATEPTYDLLEWWLSESIHPSSRSQAVSALAETFGSVDQTIRDAAVSALASKVHLSHP